MATNTSPWDDSEALPAPATATIRQPRAKRWLVLLLLLGSGVVAGGYLGVQCWVYSLHHGSPNDARVKGTLSTMSSQVPGRLLSVAVQEA